MDILRHLHAHDRDMHGNIRERFQPAPVIPGQPHVIAPADLVQLMACSTFFGIAAARNADHEVPCLTLPRSWYSNIWS